MTEKCWEKESHLLSSSYHPLSLLHPARRKPGPLCCELPLLLSSWSKGVVGAVQPTVRGVPASLLQDPGGGSPALVGQGLITGLTLGERWM